MAPAAPISTGSGTIRPFERLYKRTGWGTPCIQAGAIRRGGKRAFFRKLVPPCKFLRGHSRKLTSNKATSYAAERNTVTTVPAASLNDQQRNVVAKPLSSARSDPTDPQTRQRLSPLRPMEGRGLRRARRRQGRRSHLRRRLGQYAARSSMAEKKVRKGCWDDKPAHPGQAVSLENQNGVKGKVYLVNRSGHGRTILLFWFGVVRRPEPQQS